MPAFLRYTDFKLKHGLDRQPAFSRRTCRTGTLLKRLQSWSESARVSLESPLVGELVNPSVEV